MIEAGFVSSNPFTIEVFGTEGSLTLLRRHRRAAGQRRQGRELARRARSRPTLRTRTTAGWPPSGPASRRPTTSSARSSSPDWWSPPTRRGSGSATHVIAVPPDLHWPPRDSDNPTPRTSAHPAQPHPRQGAAQHHDQGRTHRRRRASPTPTSAATPRHADRIGVTAIADAVPETRRATRRRAGRPGLRRLPADDRREPTSTRSTSVCRTICTATRSSRRPQAGKHILCEKPLCLTPEEAVDVQDGRVADAGVTLMCAHNQLFLPAVAAAKERAGLRRLGRVYEVRTTDCFYNDFDPANMGWRASVVDQRRRRADRHRLPPDVPDAAPRRCGARSRRRPCCPPIG